MRREALTNDFVDTMPRELDEGILYVSIPYATVVHLCACGCRNKVVTPLHPARWNLTYDGETVSLHPSIGNWQFPCRSHYWIRRNRVNWAGGAWSDEAIAKGRRKDSQDLEAYFGAMPERSAEAPTSSTEHRRPSVVRRLMHFLGIG